MYYIFIYILFFYRICSPNNFVQQLHTLKILIVGRFKNTLFSKILSKNGKQFQIHRFKKFCSSNFSIKKY